MTFAPETVTLNGSGLVFANTYDSTVTAAYRSAILAAENYFQTHFTNAVTLQVSFSLSPLPAGTSGENSFFGAEGISYAELKSAWSAHATTADDRAALASLPATDPTGGAGFFLPAGLAKALGFVDPTEDDPDAVTLNSNLPWTFGTDAIGVLEHEISEGSFGRIGGLGFPTLSDNTPLWGPMDLFRYTAAGQRDYTGGRDGQPTYFSVDGTTVLTQLQYHNSLNANGVFDGADLADWDHTVGDAFGPGGPGGPGTISATDLRILDVLGWTPASPPTVTDQTAATSWTVGTAITLALAADTYTDPQGQSLTYAAKQIVNGAAVALPSWLHFTAATDSFSGTVPATATGSLALEVIATDTFGLSTAETFTVTLAPPSPPTVTDQVADQSWHAGTAITLALPADSFTDPQAFTLTYSAKQIVNGAAVALPAWLHFNATTQTFTGTLPLTASGALALEVIAKDSAGLTATETFTATLVPPSPPTVTDQIADQSWHAGTAITLALPADSVTDPQGLALTYTAKQLVGGVAVALPAWLHFNATSHAFTGTVPLTASGTLSLEVIAKDTAGLTAIESFGVTLVPPSPPTLTDQTADQTWAETAPLTLTLPADSFTDPQGLSLTYAAKQIVGGVEAVLPSWLHFSPTTRTFTGTPPVSAEGAPLTIEVVAKNLAGQTATETFGVTIVPPAPPGVSDQTPAQGWADSARISFVLPSDSITDPQGETLTYTAKQIVGGAAVALPSWLHFAPATRTFTGTVPATASGTLTIDVNAKDTSGLSADDIFTVTLGGVVASAHLATTSLDGSVQPTDPLHLIGAAQPSVLG